MATEEISSNNSELGSLMLVVTHPPHRHSQIILQVLYLKEM